MNFDLLRPGAMVACGGRNALAAIVKCFTVGPRLAFDKRISSHTGVVVSWERRKFIAEMTGRGITLSPFSKYLRPHGDRWILGIIEPLALNADGTGGLAERVNAQVAADYDRSLEYDFKGALSFALSRVHEDRRRFYCSEYFVALWRQFGVTFPEGFDVRVSPQDLYNLRHTREWFTICGGGGQCVR